MARGHPAVVPLVSERFPEFVELGTANEADIPHSAGWHNEPVAERTVRSMTPPIRNLYSAARMCHTLDG